MSSASLPPRQSDQPAIMRGDDLVRQLRQGWAPLPNRTVLALAMGGLKVRMMRSTITMVSVVLAIAFLTYMGLGNKLVKNLIGEMDRLESVHPGDLSGLGDAVKALSAVDYFGPRPQEEKKKAAVDLGLGDPSAAELEAQGLPKQIREATLAKDAIAAASSKVMKDPKALAADKTTAQAKAEAAAANLKALQEKLVADEYHIAFCAWLRNKPMAKEGMPPEKRLDDLLARWYASRTGALRQIGSLSADDLAYVKRIVGELLPRMPSDAGRTLTTLIEAEEAKRGAIDIKAALVRNGINIEESRTSSAAEYWLGGMSLLTCAIGIANAMLMSVTERFREIGTMKCLGAQDSLVIKLFLIESAFLGVIGAIAGILLGILVSVVAGVAQFGVFGLSSFPVANGLPVLGMSVLGGIVLAVLGAIGPARMAAQMRPVDALRVDE